MTIRNYGVIKGSVHDFSPGTDSFTHFQVILEDPSNRETFQADINVRSQDGSEVLYYSDSNYENPITSRLSQDVQTGHTPLPSTPNSVSVDFLRSNLFDVSKMIPLGMNAPANDDLNVLLSKVMSQAQQSSDAFVYIFGQYFEDSGYQKRRDKEHGRPAQGIHDIHMNQGNFGKWEHDNGIYQDGAIFVHFPSENHWIATFLAFQVQAFQTDSSGNPTGPSWAQEHGGEVYGTKE